MADRQATRQAIEVFFQQPAFAVVGVSADRKKFGNIIYRAMKERGSIVFPVHPRLDSVEGDACFPSVGQLPDEVRAVVTVVPPAETEKVVRECVGRGMTAVWMQQGSQSEQAAREAREAGLSVVTGQCIMMYLEPVQSIHAVHRWIARLLKMA
jgi:hypothetical protein